MALDLFIFDLAGTLVRDDGITLTVYREVAEGLDTSDGWFRRRMGMRKSRVFAELLEANGRDASGASHLAAEFSAAMAEASAQQPSG